MPNPIGANSFIVLRVVGACILFWCLAFKKISFPEKKDWPKFLLLAIFGVATNQLFFFNGLSLTSPINASIIMTSNPILVMIISSIMLGYSINAMKITGILLGAIGAITLLLSSNYSGNKESSTLGDAMILINSTSWAFYLVLVKPMMSKYHPMMITAWLFLIGSFLVLPFGISEAGTIPWSELTIWQWFAILYVVIAVTFLTYLLNMIGIQKLTPTIASAYIYFQPILAGVFAFVFSWFLDKDFTGDITLFKVFCTLLIFAGVYLVTRSEKIIRLENTGV